MKNDRFVHLKCIAALVYLLMLIVCPTSVAKDLETERAIHDALEQPLSPLESVNDFIAHSAAVGAVKPATVTVNNGCIYARLLTPLNSSFNLSGDVVKAVVVGSLNERGKPWLQEGTILEGCVEDARKANYAQTDGSLIVRFYTANVDNQRVELSTRPDTDDHTLKPSSTHLATKKQKVRGILMTATRIAIPAAIGSGGMSLAITTGAGAAIGLAFSEKGKRIQGTARGAWEGAGLTVFDPLVCKGRSVVLPEGAPLQLQLTEPVIAPLYVPGTANVKPDAKLSNKQTDSSITQLATHAEIMKPFSNGELNSEAQHATEAAVDPLASVNKKIAQNDLAGAITALSAAEELFPDDEKVKNMHKKIYALISGVKTADTESDTTH